MAKHAEYTENVFINCPFDNTFKPIFEAIVFSIFDCGFIPRCALEEDNGAEIRISKIHRIIEECKYGIHDISKADLDDNTHLARFNMPLELGLFLGAQKYSAKASYNKDKRALILDVAPYRYFQFISDIAGQDVRSHNHQTIEVVTHVVNFLHTNSRRITIPSSTFVHNRFIEFLDELPNACVASHRDRNNLTFIAFSSFIKAWLEANPY